MAGSCCLTVSAFDATHEEGGGAVDLWTTGLMQETLDRTSLEGVSQSGRVDLELAVLADKRLGGHILEGQVDGWEVIEITLPPGLAPFLTEKRAITVDAVSLTVVDVPDATFTVSLIPKTLARTTLGFRAAGDRPSTTALLPGQKAQRSALAQDMTYAEGRPNNNDSTVSAVAGTRVQPSTRPTRGRASTSSMPSGSKMRSTTKPRPTITRTRDGHQEEEREHDQRPGY
ncbi:hypothetical protein QBC39DRAFT_419154 [Podospora conica]|nr:hypothetical protein QBC39DRAFT_419154 [Schizothecium conicum]